MKHELLVEMKCLDLGILPDHMFHSLGDRSHDPFKGVSPDERRVMCRKFRKLRRKLQKKSKHKVTRLHVMHTIRMEAWSELVE